MAKTDIPAETPPKIVRPEVLYVRFDMTRQSLWRAQQDKTNPFPAPILYVGPRQPRWLEAEVDAWEIRQREITRLAMEARERARVERELARQT